MSNRLLLAFAVLLTIGSHFFQAIPGCLLNAAACFDGAYLSPFRYRILQPMLESLFVSGSQTALVFNDFMLHSLFTVLAFVGLYIWLKRWLNDTQAALGVWIAAGVCMFAFHYYYRSLGTMIEFALVVWSLILIEKRLIWQVMIVIIASLNRETAIVIPVLYYVYHWKQEKTGLHYVLLLAVYGAVTLSLHYALGNADHVLGLQGTFEYNLQNLADGLFTAFLLLPLGLLIIMRYRASTPLFKRFTWVSGWYLSAVLVGGAWGESARLLLPVLPLVLPMVLYPQAVQIKSTTLTSANWNRTMQIHSSAHKANNH